MTEPLGTVISTEGNPNSSEFSFIVSTGARKGQFVTVDTEEGKVVARIADIIKTNRYFERAESVREFERSGRPLTELFPAERWEYLVAEALALGVYNNGKLQRAALPPSPGCKVFLAENELLSKFFGLDLEKGLELGTVEHHSLPVKLNMTRLLQKHTAILGISGSGKSYGVSVFIEELLDRLPENGQIAVVAIDTHGEYTGFSKDKRYSEKADVIEGKDFRIGVPGITAAMIAELVPDMSAVQKRELNRLLALINEERRGKPFDFRDVLQKLETDEIIKKSDTRNILYTYVYDLDSTGLFASYDNPSLEKLARPGHFTVIDISDMTNQKEKQIVVTYLARKLFHARMVSGIPPFLLIVEEAHNFCPEGVHREGAISRGIIERIAREGRKFHACLCLISQRPIQLSTTALSQCNSHMILRVTNPYDLDHIGKSSEGLTADVLKTISSLRVGEALIVGEAVNYPLFLKIRERKSKKTDKGIPLEEACLEFTSNHTEKMKDAKAFM